MIKDDCQGRKSLSLRLLISGGKKVRRRKIFGGGKDGEWKKIEKENIMEKENLLREGAEPWS